MPHGHCYLWSPEMVWLQVISNLLIGAAYVAISTTLYVIFRRIKDVPFSWMFLAFGVFIITCGGTHFLDIATIWHPIYWLDGGLRAVTAIASVGTAVLLFGLVPKAFALANTAQLARERGQRLEAMYLELAGAHEKTKDLERLRTQFFANVSHELRTPLTLVLGPAERLLAGTLGAEQRQDLELIARNARTLLKHVSDPQGDVGTTRKFGGTGLGLAITKDFTELHGGSVTLGDAKEGGASLSVVLPLRAPNGAAVRDALPNEGVITTEALVDPAPVSSRSVHPSVDDARAASEPRPVVLVVEDNREMSSFVGEVLSTRYRVERAYDGEEGLAKARALWPDAIVTDMMMPRMSGEELVIAVRTVAKLRDTPIILLTAKADDDLRARVLRAGAQDYVMKPFSGEELLARIGNLVGLARLRIARDQAAEASQLKTGFLGLVSHELRTPLTAIQLLIDRLSDDGGTELAPRQKQIVDRLVSATSRLTDLVDTLLHYARIQSGHLAMNVEPFELGALAAEAAEEVRPQAHQKGLILRAERPKARIRVESDPKLMRLVVVNLVANAVKFTDRGTITVTSDAEGDRRVVRVTDTGPGISPDEQKRIFEPFQQLEPTKHKHLPGVGLGLSLVRQIVDNLGAHIMVRSELGKGSTFEVSFPAVHQSEAALAPRV